MGKPGKVMRMKKIRAWAILKKDGTLGLGNDHMHYFNATNRAIAMEYRLWGEKVIEVEIRPIKTRRRG